MAIAKTIIPIPPNQCVILLQNRIPSGKISISFIIVAPVVVNPEVVSNTILENPSIVPVRMYGRVPVKIIANQPSTTTK